MGLKMRRLFSGSNNLLKFDQLLLKTDRHLENCDFNFGFTSVRFIQRFIGCEDCERLGCQACFHLSCSQTMPRMSCGRGMHRPKPRVEECEWREGRVGGGDGDRRGDCISHADTLFCLYRGNIILTVAFAARCQTWNELLREPAASDSIGKLPFAFLAHCSHQTVPVQQQCCFLSSSCISTLNPGRETRIRTTTPTKRWVRLWFTPGAPKSLFLLPFYPFVRPSGSNYQDGRTSPPNHRLWDRREEGSLWGGVFVNETDWTWQAAEPGSKLWTERDGRPNLRAPCT